MLIASGKRLHEQWLSQLPASQGRSKAKGFAEPISPTACHDGAVAAYCCQPSRARHPDTQGEFARAYVAKKLLYAGLCGGLFLYASAGRKISL
jgi:hypothetical protein